MAQGDIITAEVKGIISDVWGAHAHNGWTAQEIQTEVAKRVQERWPGRYKEDWPGLRAVQARLPKIKENYNSKEFQDLASPWHIGVLENNILPAEDLGCFTPEALMYIQSVYKHVDSIQNVMNKAAEQFNQPVHELSLSIIEAKWIARIYKTAIEHMPEKLKKKKGLYPVEVYLLRWASVYVAHEKICKLSGTDVDTRDLDKMLRQGANPVVIGERYAIFDDDIRGCIVDPKTLQELKDNQDAGIETKADIISYLINKRYKGGEK